MEHELEDLPPELEQLFDRARQEQPPPELLEQVRGGLASQLATPMPPGSSPWALKLALTGLALGAIVGGAVWLHGAGHAPTAPAVPTRPSAELPEPDSPAPAIMDAVPAAAQASPERPTSPQTEELAQPSRPRRRPAPLPSEAELLDRAQAASRRSPARALTLTRRHARLYPHGVLAQEREALAIRALVSLHQVAPARRRLERFASQWPRSAHLHRLRQLVSEAPDAGR